MGGGNPYIPSQECDKKPQLTQASELIFQSTHSLTRMRPRLSEYDIAFSDFNPRIPSQECDSKNYQIFFYSLQFLIPIVPLLAQKLNHYILITPYFTINSQFSSANPPAFSCPLRIRTMCLLRFSPTALYLL